MPRTTIHSSIIAALILLNSSSAWTAGTLPVNKGLDDIARFIAGMPVDSTSSLFQLMQSPAFSRYHSVADSAWGRFDKNKTVKLTQWASTELTAIESSTHTLFYPFSGPDFLFATILYPNADRYILFGMEPVGLLPNPQVIKPDSLNRYFRILDKSIEDALSVSFFRTNDMKLELADDGCKGTVPILMLFAARTGNHIVSVEPFRIDTTGAFIPADSFRTYKNAANYNAGVRMRFKKSSDAKTQEIIYFSCDISDDGLKKNISCARFLEKLDTGMTCFIKSASYLMHRNSFSMIRNTVLSKSSNILQDDSGIPYWAFSRKTWQIQLFGKYDGPIDMFSKRTQEDLKKAYEKGAKSLPFRIGYDRESNLQLAIRK